MRNKQQMNSAIRIGGESISDSSGFSVDTASVDGVVEKVELPPNKLTNPVHIHIN